MASSDNHETSSEEPHIHLSREMLKDALWKAVAMLLVGFLIYVLLHLGSQLIELQGG